MIRKAVEIKNTNAIKVEQVKKEYSGLEMAKKLEIGHTYYSQLKNGIVKRCSYQLAKKISDILDLEFDDVFKEV